MKATFFFWKVLFAILLLVVTFFCLYIAEFGNNKTIHVQWQNDFFLLWYGDDIARRQTKDFDNTLSWTESVKLQRKG